MSINIWKKRSPECHSVDFVMPPVSCNSNVASSRSYMEKLACFSEVFL